MKLAYGTYGMRAQPLPRALGWLAELGYDGVELCIAEGYPTAPARLSAAARRRVAELIKESGLELCALMMLARVMADDVGHERNLRELGEACLLAHDLGAAAPPVITAAVGGSAQGWDGERAALVGRLRDWAAVAEREACIVAVEPHVGAILDRPERAAWAVAEVDSLALRLNLDISHFALQNYATQYTVALLGPLAVHAHVKDGRVVGGKPRFLLPGAAGFDYASFLRHMQEAGYDGPITVEISKRVRAYADYDPFTAARFSYGTLADAFRKAGIRRPRPGACRAARA